jgi:hypothetical protein
MLALTDEALAHLCIAATAIAPQKRAKWLRKLARQVDPDRQIRYYRRRRAGFSVIKLCADPTSLAELLASAGIFVPYSDPASVGAGLEELVRQWELGLLRVTVLRESL